ncbi:MAG TPA: mannonate dehydratase, partial [Burkholderiales bacterium]|nr:mannonate dehydratase [Burkholderiales bacterium]
VTWDADVEKNLAFVKTLGLDCVAIDLPDDPRADAAINLSTMDSATTFFRQAKTTVAAHGMELRTVLATNGFNEIKRGTAGRDQKIEFLLNAVRAMGVAGIPILAYNFKLLNSKLLRSAPTQGRGTSTYISFDYDDYLKNPAKPIDPPISEAMMRDNLSYFLNAIIPVAEKSGVRLALHPDDPPVPHGIPALAGAAHIASSFDDYRRIFDMVPSRSNGMLFCQGCVTEMKGVDVYDAIRQMGSLDKIVMVHFRNVHGEFPKFQETFVDNGDVDMYRAMRAYRDIGFKGPFSLDHSPMFPGAQIANQAFVIGYMRALIQVVYR